MNDTSFLFACGLAATVAISLGAVTYLHGPLLDLLRELCGNAERARFWAVFSNIVVVLVPVIAALQYTPSVGPSSPALKEIGSQLKWGLAGLVISVLILGQVIGRFIPRNSGSRVG